MLTTYQKVLSRYAYFMYFKQEAKCEYNPFRDKLQIT
jgi:hypothetical protein